MEIIANSLSTNVGDDCLWVNGWDIKHSNSDNTDNRHQHSICLLNTKATSLDIFPFIDNSIKLTMKKIENLLLAYLNPWISSWFVFVFNLIFKPIF